MLAEDYDREKVIDCMFDPITSELLAELENGSKDSIYLAQKYSIPETEVKSKLSYLIEHGFVIEKVVQEKLVFTANEEKLASIVDSDQFDGAIDGLTKMDSYLN